MNALNGHGQRPYIWMLGGCCCFAVMSILAHAASEHCPWQVVALFRSFLVLCFVGTYAKVTRTPLFFLRPRRLWFRSIAGSFSLVSAFCALAKLPPSMVVTLTNSFPIWVAILSWPLLGLLPSGRVWVAVLGGIVGVYLIQRPEASENDFAIVIALGSAVFTSLAMIGLHKLKEVNPNAVVVHFSMVATLFSTSAFFLFPLREDVEPFYEPLTLALLIGVGLSASCGQMLLTRAFAAGEPAKVSVVGLSQVVIALLIDVLIMNQHVTTSALVGTILILIPTAWVMLERKPVAKPLPIPVDPPRVLPCTTVESSSAS